eukprot:gene8607-6340_t
MQSNFVKGASRGKRANFEAVSPIRKSASGEGAAAAAAAADATGKRARHAQPLRVLANNEELLLLHPMTPAEAELYGNGFQSSTENSWYRNRVILNTAGMASFRIFERCGQIGAAQSSKKVALDAFAAQLTRLRQQLRDGSEAVVLQTFHEWSDPSWILGTAPAETCPVLEVFAKVWTATLRLVAATQQSELCDLQQTKNCIGQLNGMLSQHELFGLLPAVTLLVKLTPLR